MHAKRVCKKFEKKKKKKIRKIAWFVFQRDALILADVFENFQNMCLEIYEFHPAKYLSVPGLAWQRVLKKTKVK